MAGSRASSAWEVDVAAVVPVAVLVGLVGLRVSHIGPVCRMSDEDRSNRIDNHDAEVRSGSECTQPQGSPRRSGVIGRDPLDRKRAHPPKKTKKLVSRETEIRLRCADSIRC